MSVRTAAAVAVTLIKDNSAEPLQARMMVSADRQKVIEIIASAFGTRNEMVDVQ